MFKADAEEMINALKRKSPCFYDLDDEQLSTNYEFPDIGIRLWREQPFHKKLLLDNDYMDEMYQYLYFQIAAVKSRDSFWVFEHLRCYESKKERAS